MTIRKALSITPERLRNWKYQRPQKVEVRDEAKDRIIWEQGKPPYSLLHLNQLGNHLSHPSRQGEAVYSLEKLNHTRSAFKTARAVEDRHLTESSGIKWKSTCWTMRHKPSYSHWATRKQTVRQRWSVEEKRDEIRGWVNRSNSWVTDVSVRNEKEREENYSRDKIKILKLKDVCRYK